MSEPLDLQDPIAVLLAVARALRSAGLNAATYGGLALAAYGDARETKDADLAVAGITGGQAESALSAAGFVVSLAFDRVRFGGNVVSRVTLLGGPGESKGLNMADFVEPRSERFAKKALARAIAGVLRGESVRVLGPEDFVLFKILSTRDRDIEDASTVLRALGSKLDARLIDEEAALLAKEIPDHDVAGRLARARARGEGT